MNSFDAAVYLITFVAVIMGFHSGLLRSLATIFGYVCAAPFAVGTAPYLSRVLNDQFHLSPTQNWLVPFGIFLVAGMVLSALLRLAIGELVGARVSVADRLAGAMPVAQLPGIDFRSRRGFEVRKRRVVPGLAP